MLLYMLFLCTFWIISGIKFKQLHRVVRETVYIDFVFQDNDDPVPGGEDKYWLVSAKVHCVHLLNKHT